METDSLTQDDSSTLPVNDQDDRDPHMEYYDGFGQNVQTISKDAKQSLAKNVSNKFSTALSKLKIEKKVQEEMVKTQLDKEELSIESELSSTSDVETINRRVASPSRAKRSESKKREKEREEKRGRDYNVEGARPKRTHNEEKDLGYSASDESDFDYEHYKRKKNQEFENIEKEHKTKSENIESKKHHDRQNDQAKRAYFEKYGFPPYSSDENDIFAEQTDRQRTNGKNDDKFGDYYPNMDSTRFRDFSDKPTFNFNAQYSKNDDFGNENSRSFSYATPKNFNTDNDKNVNIFEKFSNSQMQELLRALSSQLELSNNGQLQEILEFIPKNLTNRGFEPQKLSVLKKQYSGFPSTLNKQSNLSSFVQYFQNVGLEFPVSNTTYNCLLLNFMGEDLKRQISDLEINIMQISSKEFITSISNGVVIPPLSSQEYKRLFYNYRFTEQDFQNPTEIILKLSSYLKKAGLSSTQIYEDLRIKLHAQFVPGNSKSGFVVQTAYPKSVHTLINYFSSNSHFVNYDREKQLNNRNKKMEVNAVQSNEQTNGQHNQENKQTDKPQMYGAPRLPYAPCEHCQKLHASNLCIRHPNPKIKEANLKSYLKKMQLKREKNGEIICLLCNSNAHVSSECNKYPNITPSQDPCGICEKLGLYARRHPENVCEVREIAKN
ncbi:MAG: hypothetical protein GY739_12230 [Mesoflavibacter sp.]|nr:hypothetical protein [Mesoflavibacter sp.]